MHALIRYFGFPILWHDQVHIPVVGYLLEANILPLSAHELSIIPIDELSELGAG